MKTWYTMMLIMALVLAGLAGGQAHAAGGGKAEVKGKELQFVDETGKVVRSIPLGEEFRDVPKNYGTIVKLREKHKKRAFTNSDGSYVAVRTDITDWVYIDMAGQQQDLYINEAGQQHYINSEGFIRTSNMKFFDGKGNLLWENQLPDEWTYDEPMFSVGGEVLAVVIWVNLKSTQERNYFTVYDRTGKVVMSAPSKEDIDNRPNLRLVYVEAISPHGKYLAVFATDGNDQWKRFYNLHNSKFWDANNNYRVAKISDEGFARIEGGETGPFEINEINLTNYIGD